MFQNSQFLLIVINHFVMGIFKGFAGAGAERGINTTQKLSQSSIVEN